MAEREKILEVRDLNISFKTDSGTVNAIRGVNLDLYRGETIAIVGESGSGKSVTTKAIMGIMAGNGSIDGGSINYTWTDEQTGEKITKDICQLSEKEMQSEIRGRKIAMVFQDPMTSLNPTMTIGNQIMEPMIHHYNTPKEEAYKKAVELLQLVGITNAEKRMKNYPHQLSGGMRQRIVIAIALPKSFCCLTKNFPDKEPSFLETTSITINIHTLNTVKGIFKIIIETNVVTIVIQLEIS